MPSLRPFQTHQILFQAPLKISNQTHNIRLCKCGFQKLAMLFKTIKTTAEGLVYSEKPDDLLEIGVASVLLLARRSVSVSTNFSAFIRLPFSLITSVAGRKRRTHKENHARGHIRPPPPATAAAATTTLPTYLHQISKRVCVCVCVCVLYFNEIIKIALSVRKASDVFHWGNALFCHFPVGFSASFTV